MSRYSNAIFYSPVIFSIKKNYLEIFHIWRSANKLDNLKFNNKEILDDVIKSFAESFEALQEHITTKTIEKNTSDTYVYSYICGHVQGCLDAVWNNRFIIKQSDHFQDLLLFKALLVYFKDNDIRSKEIYYIFQKLLEEYPARSNQEPQNTKNILFISDHKKSIQSGARDFSNKICELLEDDIMQKYQSIVGNDAAITCPDISTYVSKSNVVDIFHQLNNKN